MFDCLILEKVVPNSDGSGVKNVVVILSRKKFSAQVSNSVTLSFIAFSYSKTALTECQKNCVNSYIL